MIGESKRKARLGAEFCARGSRVVAGVVACFDDPCLFSDLLCLRVFRLPAWAEAGAYDGRYGGLFR